MLQRTAGARVVSKVLVDERRPRAVPPDR
jgi:hypothetical protein